MVASVAEVRRGPVGALGGVLLAGRIDGGRGVRSYGRPRRYPSYALTYVTAGSGRYRDSGHDLALSAGSMVQVAPGEPHWYGVTGAGTWDEVYLVFDGPLFSLAESSGVVDRTHPVQTVLPVEFWRQRIERFRLRRPPRTVQGRDAEACEVLRLLVDLQAARAVASPFSEPGDWFVLSQERLEDDLGQDVDLAQIARDVGMPYETWRRQFRTRAGVPPARYRLLRRIDAAIGLLEHTSLATREIAATLGFSDEQHLNRHFRAITHLTPRQFRNAH